MFNFYSAKLRSNPSHILLHKKMVQFSTLFNTISKNISSAPRKNNRRLGSGTQTAGDFAKAAKKNELLLTSSGAISARSNKNFACAYSKQGKKGLNQDRFVVWEEFGCQEGMVFCGVFDGHGPWGHYVSKLVRSLMPKSFLCNWQEAVALNSLNLDSTLGLNTERIQFDILEKSYFKTCAAVDQELLKHTGIDSFYSGTAALALVRQGDLMIVANVGDSRAVLATTSHNGNLVVTQLTVDLKPNLPQESTRIAQSRGRVYSCPDEPGVPRVWMPNGKTVKGPGLALSRAFGDYFIKDFGIISEPEITQRNISSRDQFAILATDGLWDVISNQEAVDIVASVRERAESAKRLVEYAVCAWKRKGRGGSMDDISAVCLFFHDQSSSAQAVEKCA